MGSTLQHRFARLATSMSAGKWEKEEMVEETTALAVPEKVENVFLAARNSREMQSSQKRLEEWLSLKLHACQKEHRELKQATDHAVKMKWNASSLRGAMNRARSRMIYYDKLLKATQAGYIIIPWMNYDAFAVRVIREEAKLLSSGTSIYNKPSIPEQPPDIAPAGEGHYVSSQSAGVQRSGVRKNKQGEDERYWWSESLDFKDVEFPVLAAKPTLMSAASNAMALKIFDEIGIAPNRRGRDPFVVGVIRGHKGPQVFLIAWYLDTRAL
jgi:hypothetical protein